jgi:hypothetical protein
VALAKSAYVHRAHPPTIVTRGGVWGCNPQGKKTTTIQTEHSTAQSLERDGSRRGPEWNSKRRGGKQAGGCPCGWLPRGAGWGCGQVASRASPCVVVSLGRERAVCHSRALFDAGRVENKQFRFVLQPATKQPTGKTWKESRDIRVPPHDTFSDM